MTAPLDGKVTLVTGGSRGIGALLVVLLGIGGLGLGIQFSALIRHLTNAVPAEYGPDISSVSTTTMQIGGAISVAAFGTLYLSLTTPADTAHATHAFAVTTAAFAVVALLSAAAAHRATRSGSGLSRAGPVETTVWAAGG